MKNCKFNEIVLFILLVVTTVLLAGCVVSDSNVRYSGVENSQLRQIKHGITTRDQLVGIVGEPTEQSATEDGAEILKYKCTTIKDNQLVIFPPPIVIDDTKETEHTVVFKIRDGIVRRHWKE
ncbi:MAG: hypothetical protein ACYS3N_15045, partial [Planctomycetota bacterium]